MKTDDWSNVCLVFNALLWVFTLTRYWLKTRYFGVGTGILFLYTGISIAAIHLYNSEEYHYLFQPLKLFPFIYLWAMILLASSPITSMNEKYLKQIEIPPMRLFHLVCVVIIVLGLYSLPNTLTALRENFLLLLVDEDAGRELYHIGAASYTSKSKSGLDVLSILSGVCTKTAFIFLFFYICSKRQNKLILYGLIVCSLLAPLHSISVGGRATTAGFLMNSVFLFLLIQNILPKQLIKRIRKAGLVLLCVLLIPFLALTISKVNGNMERAVLSIERYGAEGPLNFNNYGLDAGGIRYGDYTAVAYKFLLGMDPAMYYSGRLNKYAHMKMNESVFYTFVGDFTLDYGAIWAFFIFIGTALFFRKILRIKSGTLRFHQYLMLNLLMNGCLGYYQFPWGREEGNVQMIFLLVLAMFFKLEYDYRRHFKGFGLLPRSA